MTRWRWLAAAAIPSLLIGCSLERDLPVEAFACEAEGPCRDAGPRDPGFADAGTPDSGPRDGGLAQECPNISPLPDDGRASGTTTGAEDHHTASCAFDDGPDTSFTFMAPGRLERLIVDTAGTRYAAAVSVHRSTCLRADQITCADVQRSPRIVLEDVAAGRLNIVVDGAEGNSGPYELAVEATIGLSEPCSGAPAFMSCALGECREGKCTIHDCAGDLVDDDLDGVVDDDGDQCSSLPLTCEVSPGPYRIGDELALRAVGEGSATIVERRWKLFEENAGTATLETTTSSATSLTLDSYGRLVARYTVVDDALQASSCEIAIEALPSEQLYIELLWGEDGTDRESDLDLHLLHPTAPTWFDYDLDCSYDGRCADLVAPWGNGTTNAPIFGGDAFEAAMSPETISIPELEVTSPTVGYRIGALDIIDDVDGPTEATVRVWCLGELAYVGRAAPREDELWKAADVFFDGTACRVEGIVDDGGAPVIVPYAEAETTR